MAAVDYRALFADSPNPYMVLDRELRFVEVNEAYLAATHSRREDVIGRYAFEVFPHDPDNPDNAPATRFRASLERVFATGVAEVLPLVPYSIPGPNGLEEHFWSGSHTPIRNADGDVELVLQHVVDVTALRNAQARRPELASETVEAGVLVRAEEMEAQNFALDRQLKRFHDLFEQFPGFMCFFRGTDLAFELANAACAELVGAGRPLIGLPIRQALPELAGQPFLRLLEQVARDRQAFVGRNMPVQLARIPDAPLQTVYVNFVYQPVMDDLGGLSGVMALGFDITQQRRAELEAQRSRERLERLIDASGAGIWEVDVRSREVRLDERAAALLEAKRLVFPSAEALGEEVAHPDDLERVRVAIAAALADKSAGHYCVEHRLRQPPGARERWVESRGRAIHGKRGELRRFAGTVIDVTERTELLRQEQASRAEAERANRLKDEFLAAVSHELRTPLTAILGWIHLLRTTELSPEKRARAITVIDRNARLQAQLIEDLLDVSRIISGKLTLERGWIDLPAVVQSAVDDARWLAEARRVQVEVSIDPELSPAVGDKKRVQQVVWNLLSNAIKFSSPGGQVTIDLRQGEQQVELRLVDHGVGISAEFLPKVFERFSQDGTSLEKHGGLGLGLSIVKHIVEAHGGTVRAYSEGRGLGATFVVRLPSRRKEDAFVANATKARPN